MHKGMYQCELYCLLSLVYTIYSRLSKTVDRGLAFCSNL